MVRRKQVRQRKIYTAAQKQYAVERSIQIGATRYCRRSGLSLSTLNKWLKEYRAGVELTATGHR